MVTERLQAINRVDLKELTVRVEVLEKRARERIEIEGDRSDLPGSGSLRQHEHAHIKRVPLAFPDWRVSHEVRVIRELNGIRLRTGRLEKQGTKGEAATVLPEDTVHTR